MEVVLSAVEGGGHIRYDDEVAAFGVFVVLVVVIMPLGIA